MTPTAQRHTQSEAVPIRKKPAIAGLSKLISADEYDRLFRLAIKDHDEAVALDPASAEAYYSRGQTYYDRAALDSVSNGVLVGSNAARKAWFEPAAADFKKAIEKDGRQYLSWN
jgi:hypothetical protein